MGYELNNFRLAVESGYTGIDGTNPLVTDIVLVPVLLKFGYALPIRFGLGVQADLSAGLFYSSVTRYETALDLIMENILHDQKESFFAGARLYATWSPWKFLKIYAGGGADVIFEDDGPIPLPLIEAGISLKPLAIAAASPSKKELYGVYFTPNSTAMLDEYLPILDETGQKMAGNSSLRITLRAYSAPNGKEWQVRRSTGEPALSAARAAYIAEYLEENYGISAGRVKVKYRDAGKAEKLYRFVELIIN